MNNLLDLLFETDWGALAVMASAIVSVCAFVFMIASATNKARAQRERRFARVKSEATRGGSLVAETSLLRMQKAGAVESLASRLLPRPEVLRARLRQTGWPIGIGHYATAMFVVGGLEGISTWAFIGMPVGVAVLLAVASGFAIPHLLLGMVIKRRQARFTTEFPEGIDVIVRGLRAGLPVSESIIAVGREMSGPVHDIFEAMSERLNFGETIEEAVTGSFQLMDTPELKFFGISLSIQRETGGNLAETLSNLADILRRRRQMKLKIKALSSEARASAYILGSLPFLMFALLYTVNNEYVMQLLEDPRGKIMVTIGLFMIVCGGFIMHKMVNFEI